MLLTLRTRSGEETMRVGQVLGKSLGPGCIVGLTGDLGAGKTCLAKGIASAVTGVAAEDVTSPTFTIVQEYGGAATCWHIDAYRLAGPDDLALNGLDECLDGSGIAIIEWADRIGTALPDEHLSVVVDIVGEQERRMSLRAYGPCHGAVLARVRADLAAAGIDCREVEGDCL